MEDSVNNVVPTSEPPEATTLLVVLATKVSCLCLVIWKLERITNSGQKARPCEGGWEAATAADRLPDMPDRVPYA
jgi:hypothetical protein